MKSLSMPEAISAYSSADMLSWPIALRTCSSSPFRIASAAAFSSSETGSRAAAGAGSGLSRFCSQSSGNHTHRTNSRLQGKGMTRQAADAVSISQKLHQRERLSHPLVLLALLDGVL